MTDQTPETHEDTSVYDEPAAADQPTEDTAQLEVADAAVDAEDATPAVEAEEAVEVPVPVADVVEAADPGLFVAPEDAGGYVADADAETIGEAAVEGVTEDLDPADELRRALGGLPGEW